LSSNVTPATLVDHSPLALNVAGSAFNSTKLSQMSGILLPALPTGLRSIFIFTSCSTDEHELVLAGVAINFTRIGNPEL
jgi:hypothetical protein